MTVKKFDTAPATNSTGGTASEPINWHTGALLPRTTDIVIDYGSAKTWSRDVNWNSTRYDDLHMPNGFLIGGQNGSLPAFTKFQLKIVFRSTNQAKVPRITDLRIIALAA